MNLDLAMKSTLKSGASDLSELELLLIKEYLLHTINKETLVNPDEKWIKVEGQAGTTIDLLVEDDQ